MHYVYKPRYSVSEISINEWLNNYGPSALSLFGTWNPLFRHEVIITQNEKTNRGVHFEIHFVEKLTDNKDIKLRGLSPRANYTDRAAAAGRRS
jgi:hypothetical protein